MQALRNLSQLGKAQPVGPLVRPAGNFHHTVSASIRAHAAMTNKAQHQNHRLMRRIRYSVMHALMMVPMQDRWEADGLGCHKTQHPTLPGRLRLVAIASVPYCRTNIRVTPRFRWLLVLAGRTHPGTGTKLICLEVELHYTIGMLSRVFLLSGLSHGSKHCGECRSSPRRVVRQLSSSRVLRRRSCRVLPLLNHPCINAPPSPHRCRRRSIRECRSTRIWCNIRA